MYQLCHVFHYILYTEVLPPPLRCQYGVSEYRMEIIDGKLQNKAYCRCSVGYYGHLCQFAVPCNSNPCLRGGTCVNEQLTENGTTTYTFYRCQCFSEYYGSQCNSGSYIYLFYF